MTAPTESSSPTSRRRFGCLQVLLLMGITALVTASVSIWWIKRHIYAKQLMPVELSATEETALDAKLERIERAATGDEPTFQEGAVAAPVDDGTPEEYAEDDSKRLIDLTERELNALIARQNPAAAEKMAIDLANDLVSMKMVLPMDDEMPFVGGKTLRLRAGIGLSFQDGKAKVILRGVSLGGIPIPNAWLGNLKNVDLVKEFGEGENGFWNLFSQGIEDLRVADGRIRVKLKP